MDCLSVGEVMSMDIEVGSDDEIMSGGGCAGKKR